MKRTLVQDNVCASNIGRKGAWAKKSVLSKLKIAQEIKKINLK
jgi:hypothetical protein